MGCFKLTYYKPLQHRASLFLAHSEKESASENCVNHDHLGNTRVSYTPNLSVTGNSYSVSYMVRNFIDYFASGKALRQYSQGEGERYLTTGNERDVESGYDYRMARFSDSEIGPRFLSPDALADKAPGWTSYRYGFCNPVRFSDPTGLWEDDIYKYNGAEVARIQNNQPDRTFDVTPGTNGGWEVQQETTPAGSSGMMDKLRTANQVLNFAGVGEAAAGGLQLGMMQYRQAQPLMMKVGTFSEFSSAYNTVGTATRTLGKVSTLGGVPLNIYMDYTAMQSGEIGAGRFAYRTTGLGASIAAGAAIGGPAGAVGGAIVGGGVWAGEQLYDGLQYGIQKISEGAVNFENAIKNGWYPGN